MHTYPLQQISVDEAIDKQFKFVDTICEVFTGAEILNGGNLGLMPGLNASDTTRKAEKVIAKFFGSEDAVLVRGSGTGAIRNALASCVKQGEILLIHDAPIYPTTKVSIDELGLKTSIMDYNKLLDSHDAIHADAILVQIARQRPDDSYDALKVISTIKSKCDMPLITDDNYVVMKLSRIGVEMGADMSTFSLFKLLGPEGVGCVVGKAKYIEKIKSKQYSGGSQVQGHEAMQALRMMTYAPVAFAISADVGTEITKRLNGGEVSVVRRAYICNAQSRVILVELKEDIAAEVIKNANTLGAITYPVGSESIYEITPLFYKVSGTFSKYDSNILKRTIRINPMRAGADTIIRILEKAIKISKK